mmetsp:Transcript_27375/g.64608  ORF Transcript_27375/g.64608 Transcript_27375/m.64608 type:complete len:369 (+) Transcript_27375:85-1191(+)
MPCSEAPNVPKTPPRRCDSLLFEITIHLAEDVVSVVVALAAVTLGKLIPIEARLEQLRVRAALRLARVSHPAVAVPMDLAGRGAVDGESRRVGGRLLGDGPAVAVLGQHADVACLVAPLPNLVVVVRGSVEAQPVRVLNPHAAVGERSALAALVVHDPQLRARVAEWPAVAVGPTPGLVRGRGLGRPPADLVRRLRNVLRRPGSIALADTTHAPVDVGGIRAPVRHILVHATVVLEASNDDLVVARGQRHVRALVHRPVQPVVVDFHILVDVHVRPVVGVGAQVVHAGLLDLEGTVRHPRVEVVGRLRDQRLELGRVSELDVLDVRLLDKGHHRRVRHDLDRRVGGAVDAQLPDRGRREGQLRHVPGL